jgi:hypothetical protein
LSNHQGNKSKFIHKSAGEGEKAEPVEMGRFSEQKKKEKIISLIHTFHSNLADELRETLALILPVMDI